MVNAPCSSRVTVLSELCEQKTFCLSPSFQIENEIRPSNR
jgi:hypothetical protein